MTGMRALECDTFSHRQVVALTLMTADGAVLECSESSNADVFQAARVHLGCLGIILTVTLQCVPQFHLQETSFPSTLKEVLGFGSPLPSLRKQTEVLTKGPGPQTVPMGLWYPGERGILLHQTFLDPKETVARTLVCCKNQKNLGAY